MCPIHCICKQDDGPAVAAQGVWHHLCSSGICWIRGISGRLSGLITGSPIRSRRIRSDGSIQGHLGQHCWIRFCLSMQAA